MAAPERWFLTAEGHDHVIEVEPAGLGRRAVWRVDDHEVASRKTSDDRFQLTPRDDTLVSGVVGLRFGWFGPARRMTWHSGGDATAMLGVGGVDFAPESGSRAARRDTWIAAHPRLFTLQRVVLAILAIAAALAIGPLMAWLLAMAPWPDWQFPEIPWPDLPDLPFPNIHLPEWTLPGWVGEAFDTLKFVAPVVVAVVLARAEIRRRRRQGARRHD